jgi:uncharacterized OB-fold protein
MAETAAGARPRPRPSELTRPFWDAAARHVLVRQRCSDCGASFFTPQVACPRCLSENWAWVESSGRGSVYSFTICHRAPGPGFDVPYALAIVDLEEGWSMLSNIVCCGPHDVRTGLEVVVTWLDVDDELVLPVFRPAGTR